MKILFSVLVATVIISTPATAFAEFNPSLDISILFNKPTGPTNPLDAFIVPDKPVEQLQEPMKIEPVIHEVIEGDNLSKIGTKYKVEWQRIWAKNLTIKHPDIINAGDKLTIPDDDEKLSRKVPESVSLPKETPGVVKSDQKSGSTNRGFAMVRNGGGNTYDYGYCTWYVKNRRGGSIPNGLGNANTWYSRASSMGMAVGSIPKAGAVGTTTRGSFGHVVYVEGVNKDGTINIAEMNYKGWGVVSRRTANASEFVYIY